MREERRVYRATYVVIPSPSSPSPQCVPLLQTYVHTVPNYIQMHLPLEGSTYVRISDGITVITLSAYTQLCTHIVLA